jgi:nascent polypeptide-associated complex subunit beta
VHKAAGTDDKRLQGVLKRIGVNTIPGIEEVDIVHGDSVTRFANPKVQASIAANTYVVSGPSVTKPIGEMVGGGGAPNPAMLQQMLAQMGQGMGPDGMAGLQKLMAQMGQGGGAGAEGGDDDVPDLVEDFEAAAKEGEEAAS